MLEKSAVAEHAWKDHHSITLEKVTVVDMAKHPGELPVKEVLQIHVTHAEECSYKDIRLEILSCWVAAFRKQETRP